LLESEATPQKIAEIEESLDESPIEASSVIMPGPAYQLAFESEEARIAKLALAQKAVEVGARLGCGALITPEYKPQPLNLFFPPEPLSNLERELFMRFLADLAEHAERVSGVAMLEPINRYETHFYHRLEQVRAVCDQIDSERIKICADFFHMNIEEPDIAASIESSAGYIYHVQLGDSNRLLPGQGHICFRSGFVALQQIGYDRYLALECRIPDHPEWELPKCARYLRECIRGDQSD
jgi:sugar phosphate isomerase/epimerase